MIKNLLISKIFKNQKTNYFVVVYGWVTSKQQHNKVSFININDGSSINSLQIIYKNQNFETSSLTPGSSIKVIGKVVESKGKQQKIEILGETIEILSTSELNVSIQKNTSLEHLRSVAHLRHRTKTFLSINKIKHETLHLINNFFYKENFFQIHPPILTTNSCEGGSEAFTLSKNSNNFFNKKTLLTVSGQFYCEALALGLKNVYTLSPTFRAESSNSSNHLAEFWMLEAEMSFCNFTKLLKIIKKLIKYIVSNILKNCQEELKFLSTEVENNNDLIEKLKNCKNSKFQIIKYKDAIKLIKKNKPNIKFGDDLSSEDEQFLLKIFKEPIFVVNYPKIIKAFYMKENLDKLTVKAVDLLIPGSGELVGGSERESNIDLIKLNAKNNNISLDQLDWYLDLRKNGYYKSSGFGLGVERLILFLTGIKNIKDTVCFPRTYKQINN